MPEKVEANDLDNLGAFAFDGDSDEEIEALV